MQPDRSLALLLAVPQLQLVQKMRRNPKPYFAIDFVQLHTHFNVASPDELRALRARIGFGVAGTKEIHRALFLEHVEQNRVGTVGSLEGRDGGERPVRPGAAASKLRQVSAKDAISTVNNLGFDKFEDDSFADLLRVPEF